ncbi:MAG: panthothenate synthetase [Acidobacteriota bacterium]
MRLLVQAKLPHEPFNTAVRNGTAGKTLSHIVEELKPEAAYFTEIDGRRAAILIVDVADPSRVPAVAEPFFLTYNADVEFHIVMSSEDLARAGLDQLGKRWGR